MRRHAAKRPHACIAGWLVKISTRFGLFREAISDNKQAGGFQNMTKSSICASLLAVVFASSCATLFQGTHEEIMVESDPPGAQVSVNDGRNGTTPYSMKVSRDDDVNIHVSKPGYAPMDVSDESHMEWGYFISDFFFTGLIGLAVDGLDGAMFYHNQTMVSAHLEPIYAQSDQSSAARPAMYVVPVANQPPPVPNVAATSAAAPVANFAPPVGAAPVAIQRQQQTHIAPPTARPVADPQVNDQWEQSDHPQ
jgi:PEGA domain